MSVKGRSVDLEDFNLQKLDFSVVKESNVTNDYDLLLLLEAYKFDSRDHIISVFNDKYACEYQYTASSVQGDASAADWITQLESKYDVILREVKSDRETICVFMPMFREVDVFRLDMDLREYKTKFFFITPLEYESYRFPFKKQCCNMDIVFKRIIIEALRLHATDLHFDVIHVDMKPEYTVSYRQGSDLFKLDLFNLSAADNQTIISRLIENNTRAISLDLLTPQGVTSSASNIFGDGSIELRVSANKVLDGYHCVIRIQQKETFNFTIKKLGFHENVQRDLNRILNKRSGVTLITGAARSGKNTTAFAMANEIVKQNIKIISYESPIEVLMPFTQVDYNNSEEVLLNAIRLAKKQDINIAFLNEIPNKEVAFAVMDLVNSSVHVITTTHVDRIWHLPYKLREYYGDEYKNIISQINGVFNQKMFGINCEHCRKEMLVEDLEDECHVDFLKSRGFKKVYVSSGCSECSYTGLVVGKNQPYSEHLIFTEELKSELLSCAQPYDMERVLKNAVREQNQSLEDYMCNGFESGMLSVINLNYVI